MKLIFRCEWIKTSAGHRQKVDAQGQYLRNEKGHYVYEPCERFSVRLIPVGFPTRVGAVTDPSVHENAKVWKDAHGVVGSLQIDNISAEAVAQFKVGQEYIFDPVPIPPDPQKGA